jgi:hypothetical protein
MKAVKKPSLRGAIPLIIYAVLTIVVFVIICLIWKGQIIQLFNFLHNLI